MVRWLQNRQLPHNQTIISNFFWLQVWLQLVTASSCPVTVQNRQKAARHTHVCPFRTPIYRLSVVFPYLSSTIPPLTMTTEQYLTTSYKNEDQFTAATNRYISANYPWLRHFYFHVPNESASSDVMRIKLSAMGVLPGVPDFLFIKPFFFAIELKMPKGVLSAKQQKLIELWRQSGVPVAVCRSADEVVEFLEAVRRPGL